MCTIKESFIFSNLHFVFYSYTIFHYHYQHSVNFQSTVHKLCVPSKLHIYSSTHMYSFTPTPTIYTAITTDTCLTVFVNEHYVDYMYKRSFLYIHLHTCILSLLVYQLQLIYHRYHHQLLLSKTTVFVKEHSKDSSLYTRRSTPPLTK